LVRTQDGALADSIRLSVLLRTLLVITGLERRCRRSR